MRIITMKLDKADRGIIQLLMEDGRMPSIDIARIVSEISKRSVSYRINRLIKKAIIHVGAIPYPVALGYPVTAEVLIKAKPGKIESVAHQLSANERISYVSCSLGNHDIGILVHARDNADLRMILANEISNLPDIIDTTMVLIPMIVKDINHWQLPMSGNSQDTPSKRPPFFPTDVSVQSIDSIDRKIIHLLMEKGRLSASEIARHIEMVSSSNVIDRINRLIKSHVISVSAIINPLKVGYPIRADVQIEMGSDSIIENAYRLAKYEEISWVAAAIGGSSLSIQICSP